MYDFTVKLDFVAEMGRYLKGRMQQNNLNLQDYINRLIGEDLKEELSDYAPSETDILILAEISYVIEETRKISTQSTCIYLPMQLRLKLENKMDINKDSLSRYLQNLIQHDLASIQITNIEYRDSKNGQEAFMVGSRLHVWEVILIAKEFDMDAERVAQYFSRPVAWVNEALLFYKNTPEQIDNIILEVKTTTFETLKLKVPSLEIYTTSKK